MLIFYLSCTVRAYRRLSRKKKVGDPYKCVCDVFVGGGERERLREAPLQPWGLHNSFLPGPASLKVMIVVAAVY